jgi:hypothetical protein
MGFRHEPGLQATTGLGGAQKFAWNDRNVFSDAAVLHLQSLIADTHCLVVITLEVGLSRAG